MQLALDLLKRLSETDETLGLSGEVTLERR
jgi:hypothetical protein